MSKKKIILIVVCMLIILFIIVIALVFGKTDDLEMVSSLDSYDENDPSYDKSTAIYINFDGDTATCDSDKVKIESNITKIVDEGVYVLTGNYNGAVQIETDKKVRIILNNVNISSSDGPALYVLNADKCYVTLDENSNNSLQDSTNYSDQEATATVFSKDDIVFNGSGYLEVNGNYQNGIVSNDDLKVISGQYSITAVNNGMRGKDSVQIKNGDFKIVAGNDGIKSTNTEETDKGYIIIYDGKIDIQSNGDGIQAEKYLDIQGGTFNIMSESGSENSLKTVNSNNMFNNQAEENDTSMKGIKASEDISISGGEFNIDSTDDSIHSNGNIIISNCSINSSSGDDGIHADSEITINSGTINILKSYEGIESGIITINDGSIDIVSSDDGINIAGGNDSSSIMGRPGQNTFSNMSEYKLNINGGEIHISSSGDGIDSNGSIYINNGQIYVEGPEDDGNSSIDYEGECVMTGGLLVAVGSSGMAQTISNNSTIYCLNANLSSRQSAQTTFSVVDSSSNKLIEYTPSKSYNSIIIASDDLKLNNTYDLYINEEKYTSFSISSVITNIGNSAGGMMQQPFNKRM